MSSSDNIFDEIAYKSSQSSDEKPKSDENEGKDYTAFERRQGINSIIVTLKDKKTKKLVTYQPMYSSLLDVVSPSNELTSLFFTNYIIVIQGKNLGKIHKMVQETELAAINLFTSDHREPDSGEPKITHIERRGLKEKEGEKN